MPVTLKDAQEAFVEFEAIQTHTQQIDSRYFLFRIFLTGGGIYHKEATALKADLEGLDIEEQANAVFDNLLAQESTAEGEPDDSFRHELVEANKKAVVPARTEAEVEAEEAADRVVQAELDGHSRSSDQVQAKALVPEESR